MLCSMSLRTERCILLMLLMVVIPYQTAAMHGSVYKKDYTILKRQSSSDGFGIARKRTSLVQLQRAILLCGGAESTLSDDTSTSSKNTTCAADGDPVLEEKNQEEEEDALVLDNDALTFGASRHGDGSETDRDGLPRRFMQMQKGNRIAARKAFAATQKWRADRQVDTILCRPHTKLDQCKRIVPSYFPGRDVHGNPVFIQHFGKMDLDFSKECGCTEDDLLMHYVYIFEYCWNIWEPQVTPTEGVMTSILDLAGVGWKTVNDKDTKSFFHRMVTLMSTHYPTRSYRTFIINAPTWFGICYSLLKPLMRRSTREKISIHSKGRAQDRALKALLGDTLPPELLTTQSIIDETNANRTGTYSGKNSQIEQDIRKLCLLRLKAEGLTLAPAEDVQKTE